MAVCDLITAPRYNNAQGRVAATSETAPAMKVMAQPSSRTSSL